MKRDVPQFDAKKLCKVLEKLGFEPTSPGRHQHKYKHPTRQSVGRRPYFLFPDNLRKDRQFQKALVRDLIINWGYAEDEICDLLK